MTTMDPRTRHLQQIDQKKNSAMSALKNGKESLVVYETIRSTRQIKFGSNRATVRDFDR